MKSGDRVVLIRNTMYHNVGLIGTVKLEADRALFITFDNCSCGQTVRGYCDGFYLQSIDQCLSLLTEETPVETSVSICQCSTYDLTWLGHNLDCPEKKR